jgi:hypothetical protein
MSKRDLNRRPDDEAGADAGKPDADCATTTRTVPGLVRQGKASLRVEESDAGQLRRLYGTKTELAAELLLMTALSALGQKGDAYLELMTSMAAEMEPRGAVEAMLVTQMSATHVTITNMSARVQHAESVESREAYERSMTRLSRTFLAQMDQLKKYRAKAQQTVRVERVEVKEGGQAIVGDVSYAGGGHGRKRR